MHKGMKKLSALPASRSTPAGAKDSALRFDCGTGPIVELNRRFRAPFPVLERFYKCKNMNEVFQDKKNSVCSGEDLSL